MLWISSYAIGSVASPLETAVECSKRRIKPHTTMNQLSRTNANQTQIAIYSGGSRAIVGWRTLPTNNDAPLDLRSHEPIMRYWPVTWHSDPKRGVSQQSYPTGYRQTARQNSETTTRALLLNKATFLTQCLEVWAKRLFFIRSLKIPERQAKQKPFDVLMALLSAEVPKSRLWILSSTSRPINSQKPTEA